MLRFKVFQISLVVTELLCFHVLFYAHFVDLEFTQGIALPASLLGGIERLPSLAYDLCNLHEWERADVGVGAEMVRKVYLQPISYSDTFRSY